MKHMTHLLCVQPETLLEIHAWCHVQFDSHDYEILHKGLFLLCPVIQIEFIHAGDLIHFQLVWHMLF